MKLNQVIILVKKYCLLVCLFLPLLSYGQLYIGLEEDEMKLLIQKQKVKKIEGRFVQNNGKAKDAQIVNLRKYDDTGSILYKKDWEHFSGEFREEIRYEYAGDKLIRELVKYMDSPVKPRVYKYDDKGLLKQVEVYQDSLQKKLKLLEEFEYNEIGIIRYDYNVVGKRRACTPNNRVEYSTYNTEGDRVDKTIIYNDSCLIIKQNFFYDGRGNLIRSKRKDHKSIDETREYEWNDKDQLVKKTFQGRQLKEETFKYNSKGKIKESKKYRNGEISEKITFKYNSKGLIKKKIWRELFDKKAYYKYEYSYY